MDRPMGVIPIVLTCLFLFSAEGTKRDKMDDNHHFLQTYNDGVYDCVDFYKQPAFNHPLLANHTFHHHMEPSSSPKLRIPKTRPSQSTGVVFEPIGCPSGTVPIRRITAKDRIRERLHNEKYGSQYNVNSAETPGTHYATVRTKPSPTKRYNGGGVELSAWHPSCKGPQFSSAQIVIRNGHDNIQTGWTVNPTLYGDTHTHLFIYTSAGATQCYNTHCPGFVVINKDIPIDAVLQGSRQDARISYSQYMIYKDATDGHWWLRLGEYNVGFWPKNIFTSLAGLATSVEWGGQVYSPPYMPSPPMGSGLHLQNNTNRDAYCALISTINEAHQLVDAISLDTYTDTSHYFLKYYGYLIKDWGSVALYGGPGGLTGDAF